MIKNIGSYFALSLTISVLLYISLSAKTTSETFTSFSANVSNFNHTVHHSVGFDPAIELNSLAKPFTPHLGKSFIGFKEALGFKESGGNYFSVNTYGYLGKYQFGKETLKLIGVYNPAQFLKTPELQEKAFLANAERNKWILRREIQNFSGKKINDILITESGILAAAHLAGPGNVKKYLHTAGQLDFADGYGTTVAYYMKKFSGYDTSFVKPNRKAKVKTERS
ncbi:MAG TPA: peptidoglycan-binding protein LysM [Flavobacteriaceae bacterium]|nr:peptidoglycan-binding protein LysM [Flavobacteriaceae bacterium]